NATVAVAGVSLTGTFTVLLNNITSPFTARTVDVNGTSVSIPALPAGPYLQVSASGPTPGTHAQLTVLGIILTGDFLFERKTTNSAEKVVTVAASNVSLNLGSLTHNIVNITNGSGAFILTDEGLAGTGSVDVALGVPNLGISGTFTVRINNTSNAIDQTVDIAGSSTHLDLPTGPY